MQEDTYILIKGIHFLRGNPKGIHQRGLSLTRQTWLVDPNRIRVRTISYFIIYYYTATIFFYRCVKGTDLYCEAAKKNKVLISGILFSLFQKICLANSFDSENEFCFLILRLSILFTYISLIYNKTLIFLAHGKLKNQNRLNFKSSSRLSTASVIPREI